MKYNELKDKVLSKPNGTYSNIIWGKTIPVKNEYKDKYNLQKVTSCVCRTGIDYNNKKAVIEKRANGELPQEPQPLSWGEWKEFPYFIEHKGKNYLRINIDRNNATTTAHTMYFLNGTPIDSEKALTYCTQANLKPNTSDTLTIDTDNIINFY